MTIYKYLLLIYLMAMTPALATRQIQDKVMWMGDAYYAEVGPCICDFFEANKMPALEVESTANYKGYRAIWEVKDDKLFLKEVYQRKSDVTFDLWDKLFPEKQAPLFAYWYTGTIVLSDGKDLGLSGSAQRYMYSKELHLFFVDGILHEYITVRNERHFSKTVNQIEMDLNSSK